MKYLNMVAASSMCDVSGTNTQVDNYSDENLTLMKVTVFPCLAELTRFSRNARGSACSQNKDKMQHGVSGCSTVTSVAPYLLQVGTELKAARLFNF